MSENTVKSYSIEEIAEAFHLATELPLRESKAAFDNYLRHYTKKGKEEVKKFEIDEMNLFIRCGAYERFINDYLYISSYNKYHGRIVRTDQIDSFKRAITPLTHKYERVRNLGIPQKFLIAMTQELGFSQIEIARTLQPILDMFYDLYDEEQSYVDGQPLVDDCLEVIARYNFEAYDVCVKEYEYSYSTFNSLFRPYFRRHDMIEREEVEAFMRAYVSVSRYRTIFSNHRNVGDYRYRSDKFHDFAIDYTRRAVNNPPHKSLDSLRPFVESNPTGLDVFFVLMASFSEHLHLYFAMLAYVDPNGFPDFFKNLETNEGAVEEFLHELEIFSAQYHDVYVDYPRTGIEPDDLVEEVNLFTEKKTSAPKVEIVPGEERLAAVKEEPSPQPTMEEPEQEQAVSNEIVPTNTNDASSEPMKEPNIFTPIIEQVNYRRNEAEGRLGEIDGETFVLKRRLEALELERMETMALINFYDEYQKNNS